MRFLSYLGDLQDIAPAQVVEACAPNELDVVQLTERMVRWARKSLLEQRLKWKEEVTTDAEQFAETFRLLASCGLKKSVRIAVKE